MKLWIALRNAVLGWVLLLKGQPNWRDSFTLTPPGLTAAIAIYALLAFFGVALASLNIGMPGLFGMLAAMAVLTLPLASLAMMYFGTRRNTQSSAPVLDTMVPGTYLMSGFLIVEGLLAAAGPIVMLSWLVLAYLLYRLARAATGWNVALAAGFAVLTVVLLVALRVALYMLSNLITPA